MLTGCHNLFVLTELLKVALHIAKAMDCMRINELSDGRMINLTLLKCFDRSSVHYDTLAYAAMRRAGKQCVSRNRESHRVLEDKCGGKVWKQFTCKAGSTLL